MFAEQLLGISQLREVLTWYLPFGIFTSFMLLILFLVPVVDGWHGGNSRVRDNQLFCKEVSPAGQNLITPLRIDAFELWCWRRLLRVPWTAKRSNQSILKEISSECSLELRKLKLQYFGHLMQKANSMDKTLMLGKTEGRRRRGRQRIR